MEKLPCSFCEIAAKRAPALIVYENDRVIGLLPKKLEVYGHTLLLPREHFESLYDTPEDVLCDLIRACEQLALSYKESINATGMYLLHASGKDAQQSASHFHIHLLPRFKDDHLDAWPKLPALEINREDLLRWLKAG
jgi:histidine triad (HIT) family protein